MILLSLLVVSLLTVYFYTTKNFKYWQKRGVKHDKPIPFFGNYFLYLMKKSATQVAVEAYWKYPNEKVVGLFRGWMPELVIRDPEIIKRILVTDFSTFYARGINHKEVVEPLMRNLFFADGDLWRLLRQRTTPAFSSGRLRAMFPLVQARAERLQARALQAAHDARVVDVRDLMARFTTDFIGACGFGLDADSLNEERSAFRRLGAKIFQIGVKDAAVSLLKDLFPDTFKHFKYLSRLEAEFVKFVSDILEHRKNGPSGRNDFIDLMLECKSEGTIVGESIERVKPDGSPELASLEFDDALIAAQVFVFFAAGFETSSSATSYTLHQLAYHPEIQEKVQKEIDTVLAKHGNELSFEAIKEMTYLEWAFKEAMRMFPSLGFLIRKSAQKYTFPELDLTIDEGVTVIIPVQALHNDPQYFEQPQEFRPERFHPDAFSDCHKFVYLPFGGGPRACVARVLQASGWACCSRWRGWRPCCRAAACGPPPRRSARRASTRAPTSCRPSPAACRCGCWPGPTYVAFDSLTHELTIGNYSRPNTSWGAGAGRLNSFNVFILQNLQAHLRRQLEKKHRCKMMEKTKILPKPPHEDS